MQVAAGAGNAAIGHFADAAPKPTSVGVTTMPSDVARFSTQTLPIGVAVGVPSVVEIAQAVAERNDGGERALNPARRMRP